MAIMFLDGCDFSLYENNKWSSIVPNPTLSGVQIEHLPNGGVNGDGAYRLYADNTIPPYFGKMTLVGSNDKNYILVKYPNAAASTPSGTTTRISFWMKCETNISSSILRTSPFLILDSTESKALFDTTGNNAYYYNTGLPLFLDSSGRISVRQVMNTYDYTNLNIFSDSPDYFRSNTISNEHARLDDTNWHHIEIAISIISTTSVILTVHVDGNLYSSLDRDLIGAAYVPRTIDQVYFTSIPDMNIIYDNIVIWQDIPDTNYIGYKGPTKIYSSVASANSTPSNAIPSTGPSSDKWGLVGGAPYNNSWSLNQTWVSLPVGGKEFYEMSNIGNVETIQAISYRMNYASTYKPITIPSPGIVTSNLVLYLDAGNANSFPGVSNTSGTVWYDISGFGKHASFVNTPSYNPISGCFELDYFDYFLGSQTYNTPSLPVGSSSRTIIAGFRTPNSSSFGNNLHVFHYGSQSTSQASGMWLVDQFNNNTYYISHHGWSDSPYMLNYPLEISKDYIAAIRYDNTTSPKLSGFINGAFQTFSFDSNLNTGTNFQYYVASRIDSTGTEFLQPDGSAGARVYFVMVYDRALTDGEISQVYNTMKNRFPDLSTITNYANVRPVLISNGVTYNGAVRSGTTASYNEFSEYLYTDFGNSNTNWTASSVNSLIAGFENVG